MNPPSTSRRLISTAALATCLSFAAAPPAEAAGDGSGFSWNAALTSDYVFRGVSQSDEDPAVQLGADFGFAGGFYLGAWASTIDFTPASDADIELDMFFGWRGDLARSVSLDVQLVRYTYIGQSSSEPSLDYLELIADLTLLEAFTISLAHSNDIFNSGSNGSYLGLAQRFELPAGLGLTVNAGRSVYSGGVGLDDYTDFGASLDRSFGPINLALAFVGTDGKGRDNFGRLADNRIVLTASVEF